jgi:serine protease
MKCWVWMGLLGLVAGCTEMGPFEQLPSLEETPDCTSASGQALPSAEGASWALGRDAEIPEPTEDGREPFLIRYRRTVSAASAAQAASDAVTRLGGKVKVRWGHLGTVAARLTAEERAALAREPDVLSIERDGWVHALTRQAVVTAGTVGEYTEGLKQVQAPEVWDANHDGTLDDKAPNGSGIKVCVIDSGWDNRHPELAPAYAGGKDFVDDDDEPLDFNPLTGRWGEGHGMHTAATIVAQLGSAGTVAPGDDLNGVVGVAPGAELLVARVLNVAGRGERSDIISALHWCEQQGARIASLSLGTSHRSTAEEEAFQRAAAVGMLVIAASGNDGTGDPATEPPLSYPARYAGVLAVGAVDFDGKHPTFSQVGPQLSLVAPGVGVLSAVPLGGATSSHVEVSGKLFASHSLRLAPPGEYTGKLLTCGVGGSRDACGHEATCQGFVAYVDRGGVDARGKSLTATSLVRAMRRAGAMAVIIGNNDPSGGAGDFGLDPLGTWVPSASISSEDGATLKGLKGQAARVKLSSVDYTRWDGTSMAAPHVSGVAALLWSARPSLSAAEVRKLLEDSARDLGPAGHDATYGHGLVQAKAALDLLHSRFPAP